MIRTSSHFNAHYGKYYIRLVYEGFCLHAGEQCRYWSLYINGLYHCRVYSIDEAIEEAEWCISHYNLMTNH